MVQLFQFHLVRLKVAQYGEASVIPMFQFHLVRLKARHDRAQPARASAFQFHLVRLKDFAVGEYGPQTFVSIPFSTIKSMSWLIGSLVKFCFNSI